jgi:hypothetical protein
MSDKAEAKAGEAIAQLKTIAAICRDLNRAKESWQGEFLTHEQADHALTLLRSLSAADSRLEELYRELEHELTKRD